MSFGIECRLLRGRQRHVLIWKRGCEFTRNKKAPRNLRTNAALTTQKASGGYVCVADARNEQGRQLSEYIYRTTFLINSLLICAWWMDSAVSFGGVQPEEMIIQTIPNSRLTDHLVATLTRETNSSACTRKPVDAFSVARMGFFFFPFFSLHITQKSHFPLGRMDDRMRNTHNDRKATFH
jgi:hypothetical protein